MKYGNYVIDTNEKTSIGKLIRQITPGSKVVEFGSSHGYILEYLKNNNNCHVQGYEIDDESVALAKKKGIDTKQVDLDNIGYDFIDHLDKDFDYIICADVLEHLKNIRSFLKLISSYMNINRKCNLLVSIPNITYYGVIDNLIKGIFKYSDLGVLDSTHLHFFDRIELIKLFNNNNLNILSVDEVIVHPKDSEFNVDLNEQVVLLLKKFGNNDYLFYQYVFKLEYSDNPKIFQTEKINAQVITDNIQNDNNQIISKLNNIISNRDNDIIKLNKIIHKYDNDIYKFKKILNHRDNDIENLNNALVSLNKDIERLKNILDSKENDIVELKEVLSHRDNDIAELKIILKKLETDISNLKRVLSHRKSDIAGLDLIIKQNSRDINELIEKTAKYKNQIAALTIERDSALKKFHEIQSSTAWKITLPMRFIGCLLKGNFSLAKQMINKAAQRVLPRSIYDFLSHNLHQVSVSLAAMPISDSNYAAATEIVNQRQELTRLELRTDPLYAPPLITCPAIDISIVTYNSARWITDFTASLLKIDYPKELITLYFVDNSSTDSTVDDLRTAAKELTQAGFAVDIDRQPNHGFGSGHNHTVLKGNSPFLLVTNIDITFEKGALNNIVAVAVSDAPQVAAWELRQKPFEHPKFYDPVTGLTNWNSHACVLLRRKAIEQVGSYDSSLFMYGEDVELSYRLRRAGFLLRYCPQAAVWHYTYEEANQVKPLQYTGSTFANLYLRMKYGEYRDILAILPLGASLLKAPDVYPGSKRAVAKNLLKLLTLVPQALLSRQRSKVHFPFRIWDYELSREGAFFQQDSLPPTLPLVTVITRTFNGRELYLRQALLSVAHQTYLNIEHIVVEDGGESMRTVVDNINKQSDKNIKFIPLEKVGRSAVGNAGLSAAQGRWCLFLDDDDLLFADHVETLVTALFKNTDCVATYSLAWDIKTEQTGKGEYRETSHQVLPLFKQDFDYNLLRKYNYISIQAILFEHKLFKKRGGFDEDLDALEDWVLWKKYAYKNKFHYVPKVTSMFRTPSNPKEIKKRQQILNDAYPVAQKR